MSEVGFLNERPILVVEDTQDDFETVVEAARRARLQNPLVHAPDADAAHGLLASASRDTFAFMLLDYNLPGMDGLTFLREVRQDPIHAKLPVVVFTSSVNPRDRDAFYAAGADAFHIKQLRFEDCLSTLQHIFDKWLKQQTVPQPIDFLALPLPQDRLS